MYHYLSMRIIYKYNEDDRIQNEEKQMKKNLVQIVTVDLANGYRQE